MNTQEPTAFITPDALLRHWQGHRRVTRRIIDTFPEEELFKFSIGGMRTFGEMCRELLSMAIPTVKGVITEEWVQARNDCSTKGEVLARWDGDTAALDELFPQIPPERFFETRTAFGLYTMTVHDLLLYVIDNEIHHRGQGYVYLRALGLEPPAFYDRS